MLGETAGYSIFRQTDLVRVSYQMALRPDYAHIHTFRSADSHSLYQPTGALKCFKNSGTNLQVYLSDENQMESPALEEKFYELLGKPVKELKRRA